MTQVCLLDSNHLSNLLSEALSWSDAVSSLLVSAQNGSVLAYAFRTTAPSIKNMRTKSTTIAAAYKAASEETLVFESQDTGAISVITPVADHLLLAVGGAEPDDAEAIRRELFTSREGDQSEAHTDGHAQVESNEAADDDEDRAQIRVDLESVSVELAGILREELTGMKWPDDI